MQSYLGRCTEAWRGEITGLVQGPTRMAGENWKSAAAAIAGKWSRVKHRLQNQRRAGEEGAR